LIPGLAELSDADGAAERAPRTELTRRIHAVEEAYEFMLAYAAQGLSGDAGSPSGLPAEAPVAEGGLPTAARSAKVGGQLRELLTGAAAALRGIGALVPAVVAHERRGSPEQYAAFREVLESDARASLAAFELVLAQPSISSQLVDNLNASIHVRALLTDLFLLDEILKESLS
jgi:hypothetical protein